MMKIKNKLNKKFSRALVLLTILALLYFNSPTAGAVATQLSVVATAGAKIPNLNSGDTTKYINDPTCTAEAACSAFKISAASGAITITSIKITESGTVPANTTLANPTLLYDTDANFANGGLTTFGTQASFASDQTATFTNAGVTIPSGSTYYFYVRTDLANGSNYPVGGSTINFQITASTDIGSNATTNSSSFPVTLAGTTVIKPTITSYTNSTEPALSYTSSCSNCGARIGPGAPFRQTLVISGYGFGADPGLGSRSTVNNKVEVVGLSTTALSDDGSANTNVSAWSNTSITVNTDSNITGNTEANWGTNYGGQAAFRVTAGGQADATSLNFYVFPQITSLTTNSLPNAAREYDAGDTDGTITLNGTRFGSGSTGGWVRIFGCDSSTCSSPSGSATTTSWNSTAITVQVPTVIANNVYLGSLLMQQGTGTLNKSFTYTSSGFRILPRVTSISPSTGSVGDAFTFNGNHFCQNNGTCPSAYNTSNYAMFGGNYQGIVFTGWNDAQITTQVPANASNGNTFIQSNGYNSNYKVFTFLSSTPADPTYLKQFINSALTTPLATGGLASSTNLYLTMSIGTVLGSGTIYPQAEIEPIGTAFTCVGTSTCAQVTEGPGVASPGPYYCDSFSSGCAITATPATGNSHWQGRIRYHVGGTDYFSNWVSYGANDESATDFSFDNTPPIISFYGANTCNDGATVVNSNGATIGWTTNENSSGQVKYSKNSDLSGGITLPLDASSSSHAYSLNNLDSNTTYYYQVRAYDMAGNLATRPTAASYCSFTTTNVTQPAKTVRFYINSIPGALAGSVATSSNFSVYVPESSVSVKSAFLELKGFSPAMGLNNIYVSVNGQASVTYTSGSFYNNFRILYKIDPANLNFDPIVNTMNLSSDSSIYFTSANLVLTYSFAP